MPAMSRAATSRPQQVARRTSELDLFLSTARETIYPRRRVCNHQSRCTYLGALAYVLARKQSLAWQRFCTSRGAKRHIRWSKIRGLSIKTGPFNALLPSSHSTDLLPWEVLWRSRIGHES